MGYSPWGCKESSMTERQERVHAHTHTHTHTHTFPGSEQVWIRCSQGSRKTLNIGT